MGKKSLLKIMYQGVQPSNSHCINMGVIPWHLEEKLHKVYIFLKMKWIGGYPAKSRLVSRLPIQVTGIWYARYLSFTGLLNWNWEFVLEAYPKQTHDSCQHPLARVVHPLSGFKIKNLKPFCTRLATIPVLWCPEYFTKAGPHRREHLKTVLYSALVIALCHLLVAICSKYNIVCSTVVSSKVF